MLTANHSLLAPRVAHSVKRILARPLQIRAPHNPQVARCKWLSTSVASRSNDIQLRRSFLYVPTSSQRMLEKSLVSKSDIMIYDLEDSVAPADKQTARRNLQDFIKNSKNLPRRDRIAVRLNGITTSSFEDDISLALRLPSVGTLVLPKVHSAEDLHHVSNQIHKLINVDSSRNPTEAPLDIIASIESAKGLWNLGEIASWKSSYGPESGVRLSALLFAAEDYCADTSILRSLSRTELLYTRSEIVIAAKAFGLEAIDMVCVNYKDLAYLKEECEDGRRLGFSGKQAIHPTQVEVIQSAFAPTSKEIFRAAKILKQMELAHAGGKGAFGLELEGGGKEMIDAPMLKQAEKVIAAAKAAGIDIPKIDGDAVGEVRRQ